MLPLARQLRTADQKRQESRKDALKMRPRCLWGALLQIHNCNPTYVNSESIAVACWCYFLLEAKQSVACFCDVHALDDQILNTSWRKATPKENHSLQQCLWTNTNVHESSRIENQILQQEWRNTHSGGAAVRVAPRNNVFTYEPREMTLQFFAKLLQDEAQRLATLRGCQCK